MLHCGKDFECRRKKPFWHCFPKPLAIVALHTASLAQGLKPHTTGETPGELTAVWRAGSGLMAVEQPPKALLVSVDHPGSELNPVPLSESAGIWLKLFCYSRARE